VHTITVESGARPASVTAAGELDAFVAPELTAAFDELAGAMQVLLDLRRVSFLDSTALGLVVRAVREIGERGGAARVVLPASPARRIFELTALDRALPVAESREDGLAELALVRKTGIP
jgi:anti-sigma B factor antagonist